MQFHSITVYSRTLHRFPHLTTLSRAIGVLLSQEPDGHRAAVVRWERETGHGVFIVINFYYQDLYQ